jgi:hypothetical protein
MLRNLAATAASASCPTRALTHRTHEAAHHIGGAKPGLLGQAVAAQTDERLTLYQFLSALP